MAVPFVPFPLLLRLVYPDGQRLQKRTAFVEPKPVQQNLPVVYRSPNNDFRPTNMPRPNPSSSPVVPPGNLTNDEYRFWTGAIEPRALTGRCRVCGKIKASFTDRANHLAAGPCKSISLVVATTLRRLNKCAVCGKTQYHSIWGIPLCAECVEPWRFLEPRAQSPYSVTMLEVMRKMNEDSLDESLQR